MKNPIAEAYLKMLQEAKKEKEMDPVGKADADIDNDGDVDDSDEYLHKRRKAIKKSMKEEVCGECGKEPCECEDEDEVDEACGKSKKEAVSIDPDDGEVTKAKDGDKKKKKEAEAQDVEENLNFNIATSKAGREYQSRKAKERQDQHKKQDPKHAKTHARNMVDMDKASKKADKKGVSMRDYGKDAWKVRNGVKRGKLPEQMEEGVELAEGKKLRNVLTDREFEKSMKKALADKGNYKGGKVNWNFIDADVYMELSAKGYDLRHPSINYMKRFDALADKLDPEMNESVELDEAFNKGDSVTVKNARKYDSLSKPQVSGTVIGKMGSKVMVKVGSGQMNVDPKDLVNEAALTVGMKQPVDIDDTEEKGHMDAVKANKAGPGPAKPNKAKKLKELRK